MLYRLLKIPARIALPFYCRRILVNNKDYFNCSGPLLLACNHPNSFLDAVILATLFRRPVYSLARGDAFGTRWSRFLLKELNILPVYRQREGAEHLHKNYDTFDACQEIFQQQGIVLIFSEALCENEWHLRPLKKGTARLALAAWQQNIPLKILPVAVNYSSFKLFGKNIHLRLGSFIEQPTGISLSEQGRLLTHITSQVQEQLKGSVYEIAATDHHKRKEIFTIPVNGLKKTLLSVPSLLAVLLHWPLYLPVLSLVRSKAFDSVHYDSIMVGMLFLLYPVYMVMLCLLTFYLAGGMWWVVTLFAVPFCAWSYIQLKKQTD